MTTTNYARVGQAFKALLTYSLTTAFAAPTNTSGNSVTWTSPSGSTPGFFTFTSTTPVVSNQYNVLESLAKPNLLLEYVSNQPELNQVYTINAAESTGAHQTIFGFFANACVALLAALKDICGTTGIGESVSTVYLTGASGSSRSAIYCGMFGSNTWDVLFINFVLYNAFYNNATYAMNQVGFQKTPTPNVVQVTPSAAVTVNVGPPLDVDLSVNQLQGQVSTVSKTTTFP